MQNKEGMFQRASFSHVVCVLIKSHKHSAIHFLAGIGDVKVLPKLLFEGTNVNAQVNSTYFIMVAYSGEV
jgi:hypothetical protein